MNSIALKTRIGGKKQLGQGMTEYIIIVALVAIAAIGVYSAFGHTLQKNVAAVTEAVGGNGTAAKQDVSDAKTIAGKATTDASAALGMDDYANTAIDK